MCLALEIIKVPIPSEHRGRALFCCEEAYKDAVLDAYTLPSLQLCIPLLWTYLNQQRCNFLCFCLHFSSSSLSSFLAPVLLVATSFWSLSILGWTLWPWISCYSYLWTVHWFVCYCAAFGRQKLPLPSLSTQHNTSCRSSSWHPARRMGGLLQLENNVKRFKDWKKIHYIFKDFIASPQKM